MDFIRTNAALEKMEARIQHLEVCRDRRWVNRFGGFDFGVNDESDRELAESMFLMAVHEGLDEADLLWIVSPDERATCDAWNAEKGFSHRIGPIGSYHDLGDAEVEQLREIVREAESRARQEIADRVVVRA
ncbi:MAG: hypothetical protein WD049_06005 [Candidatus Paceibacterota bacterium]